MVDNIKFNLVVNKNVYTSYSWNVYTPTFKNGKFPAKRYTYYKRRVYNQKRYMTVKLRYDNSLSQYRLTLTGSLRKWYFGKNTRQNLTLTNFKECIKILSEKTGIKEAKLWKANITRIECGVTIILPHKFKNIINCFIKYKNFEREIKGETTLYFKGENFNLMMYDKFDEINKNKILNDTKKLVKRKLYVFRFEVDVTKVSGVAFYEKTAKTLNKVRLNWAKLAHQIIEYYNDIIFIDIYSSDRKPNLKSYPDLKEYLLFQGIKKVGIEETLTFFDKIETGINKSRYLKDLLSKYQLKITDGDLRKVRVEKLLLKKLDQILL